MGSVTVAWEDVISAIHLISTHLIVLLATAVDLPGGLKNAGFTVNQELVDKYSVFRADRPSIEINNGQDWSLPEPTADSYDQTLLDNAKNFSDWAIVVIAEILLVRSYLKKKTG